jgi:hypothetical protein
MDKIVIHRDDVNELKARGLELIRSHISGVEKKKGAPLTRAEALHEVMVIGVAGRLIEGSEDDTTEMERIASSPRNKTFTAEDIADSIDNRYFGTQSDIFTLDVEIMDEYSYDESKGFDEDDEK